MSDYNRDRAQAVLDENGREKPRNYPIDPNALAFRLSRALEQLRAAMDIIDDVPSDVLTSILAQRIPAAVLAMRPPRKEWSIDDLPSGGSIDFGVAVGLTTPGEFERLTNAAMSARQADAIVNSDKAVDFPTAMQAIANQSQGSMRFTPSPEDVAAMMTPPEPHTKRRGIPLNGEPQLQLGEHEDREGKPRHADQPQDQAVGQRHGVLRQKIQTSDRDAGGDQQHERPDRQRCAGIEQPLGDAGN